MRFPIPTSFPDLERNPYNLSPYPLDFDDDDEAARADSFDRLVNLLDDGHCELNNDGILLFCNNRCEDNGDDGAGGGTTTWCDVDRVQALYTLVRKSSSLAPRTRVKFIKVLCNTIHAFCSILSSSPSSISDDGDGEDDDNNTNNKESQSSLETTLPLVVPQSFRDAFSCHLYMLYSIMFVYESDAKQNAQIKSPTKKKGKSRSKSSSSSKSSENAVAAAREDCAKAMQAASQAMGQYQSKLWVRGVPDEDVTSLPCRIAYQMLENSSGVLARKAASAELALGMIAATVDSTDSQMSMIIAALVDLMHSYEHIAVLTAELCCLVSEQPTNKLAIELLREIGRLNNVSHDTVGRASGVRNVAPFITELAKKRPWLVLGNISTILPLLNAEPYNLRSAIVTAVAHILVTFNNETENEYNQKKDDFSNDNNDNENDSEGEEQSTSQSQNSRVKSKKSRESLLEILMERIYDKNSFTRATTLKAWGILLDNDALPVDRYTSVTALAIDRLRDKAVIVRRAAMQLLTLLLENNPFGASIDPIPFLSGAEKLKQYLKTNMPQKFRDAIDEVNSAQGNITDDEKEANEQAAFMAIMNEDFLDANTTNLDLDKKDMDYLSKVRALKFALSAVEFIDLFENSNFAFESMLRSVSVSDVTEALKFFVRARHFQLPCAVTGMKKALGLMWSSEKNVKEEVMKAFVEVFIGDPGCVIESDTLMPDKLLSDKQIAQNLLILVDDANPSELASIEEGVKTLVEKKVIPMETFLILWSIASSTTTVNVRATALLILSMGAAADSDLINSSSRLRLLYEAGFEDYVEENRDWETISAAALLLQKIGKQSKNQPGSAKAIIIDVILERLDIISQGAWCRDDTEEDTKHWFSAAEKSINAIFTISPEPEKICTNILHGLEASAFGTCVETTKSNCSVLRLSRLFFVVGHISLKLLVYTEALTGSLRRAQASKTVSKQSEASNKTNDSSDDNNDEADAIEDELGVAAEAEAENERRLAEITEKEIIGRGLIGVFSPLLLSVLVNDSMLFSSKILAQSACLALCKFMCISMSFCEKHLPLLFDILAKATDLEDISLISNIIIALGDLAFRFPNAVEPYTPRIYACLRDKSTRVRKNTLMVLMHLILNDMVKVKGQVCEIALCLEDEDNSIRDLARLLFCELSKRSNNPIYNLLPDIISNLSQQQTNKQSFRSIMSFLLNFIGKERQSEMLVEKLCHRFPTCTSISQKADVAFCLSQIKINAKSLKILNDLFKCYKDALFDPDVHKCFVDILTKVKKTSSFNSSTDGSKSQDLKDILIEWEEKIKNANASGMDNKEADDKAKKAKARAKKREKAIQALEDANDGRNKSSAHSTRSTRSRRALTQIQVEQDEMDVDEQ